MRRRAGPATSNGAEARQAEIDALVGQLAAAFGIGGRDRRVSATVERARLNVTRAVRSAIRRITEVLDLGGKQIRAIPTPHVPRGWEAHVLFEETTGTLFCGDLFSNVGAPPPLTSGDIVSAALAAEVMFGAMSNAPRTGAVLRGLGDLQPRTLAVMHGSSFEGDGRQALDDLAAGVEEMAAPASAPG